MTSNPFILHPDCISNRNQLKSILSDLFPTEKVKVNTILVAFDEGIIDAIKQEDIINNQFAQKFLQILIFDYGIAETNARWAVNFWINSFAIEYLSKNHQYKIEDIFIHEKNNTRTNHLHNTRTTSKLVSLKKLEQNEKIPKSFIKRNTKKEKEFGINDFRCSIRKEYENENTITLKITGEYEANSLENLIIFFMFFNDEGQLIEALFEECINKDYSGKRAFSLLAFMPIDECISKIETNITINPALIW